MCRNWFFVGAKNRLKFVKQQLHRDWEGCCVWFGWPRGCRIQSCWMTEKCSESEFNEQLCWRVHLSTELQRSVVGSKWMSPKFKIGICRFSVLKSALVGFEGLVKQIKLPNSRDVEELETKCSQKGLFSISIASLSPQVTFKCTIYVHMHSLPRNTFFLIT